MSVLRCLLLLILAVVAGCSRGTVALPKATVSGTVTRQGKPLVGGWIIFLHSSGQGVGGDISTDGTFKLDAFQGKNQVAIECFAPEQPGSSVKAGPRSVTPRKSLIPIRYAEVATSGLTLEVKPGDNDKAEFTLTD
jgi:hypothetical protein